jgi:hypothetical protein
MWMAEDGIMKNIVDVKKERGCAVVRGKTPETQVSCGTPQGVSSRSQGKRRRSDEIDREYQIWREELL